MTTTILLPMIDPSIDRPSFDQAAGRGRVYDGDDHDRDQVVDGVPQVTGDQLSLELEAGNKERIKSLFVRMRRVGGYLPHDHHCDYKCQPLTGRRRLFRSAALAQPLLLPASSSG